MTPAVHMRSQRLLPHVFIRAPKRMRRNTLRY